LADFVLDFAAGLFYLAFGFEVRLVRGAANFLFDRALYFVKLSSGFVLCALSHDMAPFSAGSTESARRG
jgi:hypothetical protein